MKRHLAVGGALAAAAAVFLAQCGTGPAPRSAADHEGLAAWDVVYDVLQHPRCLNCHPVGDHPFQGDDSRVHAQNVQRGEDGRGRFALRCDACHQQQNLDGAHLPPGAPNWHLPHPEMPLVFEGRSKRALALQLADPAQNGGKTMAQIFDHVAHDKLVLWGWDPGRGRAPVHVPHAEFVAAMRTWIDRGCPAPDEGSR